MPKKKKPLLKEKDTFKSADEEGSDFHGILMFCAKVRTKKQGPVMPPAYYIIFSDGGSDWFSEEELNIDKKTIKPYHTRCGIDFYGMHG